MKLVERLYRQQVYGWVSNNPNGRNTSCETSLTAVAVNPAPRSAVVDNPVPGSAVLDNLTLFNA
jgi:hypothetical protein